MTQDRPLRILSIDGGGIRGLIPAVLLAKFEEKIREKDPDGSIADYFDLFAGTSTGGILVSGLLSPSINKYHKWNYNAYELIDIYREWGPKIFANTFGHRVKSGFGLKSSKYPSKGLDDCLQAYFGNLSLSQLGKPCLIPSYDVERKKTHFFTRHDAREDFNQDFYLWDVIRSTTAAPTYFEASTIYSLGDFRNRQRYTMIDGGIYAHNPALCAYAEARANPYFRKITDEVSASNMILFSLGTGDTKSPYSPDQVKSWGLIKWARPLVGIMMGAAAEAIHYQLTQVFGSVEAKDQYQRIDPDLPDDVSPYMDDASPENIESLVRFAYQLAESPEVEKKFNTVLNYIFETEE